MTEENKEKQTGTKSRYLCFRVGQETFAIPLLQVKEVIGNQNSTSIPQAQPYFKGIINLRGNVIAIIDLKQKLKISKVANTKETSIIILDIEDLSLGVLVDDVESVVEFDSSDLSDPPEVESTTKNKFISAVARLENSMTLILDLKSALDTEDYKIAKKQMKNTAA